MGNRSWWTWLLCRLIGHDWRIGWCAPPRDAVRGRWCQRQDCGAFEMRDVPAGEKWHVPTLEEQGLR